MTPWLKPCFLYLQNLDFFGGAKWISSINGCQAPSHDQVPKLEIPSLGPQAKTGEVSQHDADKQAILNHKLPRLSLARVCPVALSCFCSSDTTITVEQKSPCSISHLGYEPIGQLFPKIGAKVISSSGSLSLLVPSQVACVRIAI